MNHIKRTIATKYVGEYQLDRSRNETHLPQVGDVAVFKVVQIGKHPTIQSPQASNIYLFEGDTILATFGHRYATQVFEGTVPNRPQSVYHLLGKGGVVGQVKYTNAKALKVGPTLLELQGYAVDKMGTILNTLTLAQSDNLPCRMNNQPPQVVLSIGSTMDSGKTTTAGYLCASLKRVGFSTAYIKLTGTTFAKDMTFVANRGADFATDFSAMGYPSTYLCSLEELLTLYHNLLASVQSRIAADYVVIEIADGLLQRETDLLLSSPVFMNTISAVVFSASDSLGVLGGLQLLHTKNISPTIISGCFTISPMLVNVVKAVVNIPILNLEQLLQQSANLLSITQEAENNSFAYPEGVVFNLQ